MGFEENHCPYAHLAGLFLKDQPSIVGPLLTDVSALHTENRKGEGHGHRRSRETATLWLHSSPCLFKGKSCLTSPIVRHSTATRITFFHRRGSRHAEDWLE